MWFSMFSARRIFWTFAVLATLMGAALLFFGKQPVYAQVAGNRIPDLRANWILYMSNACGFLDMLDPTVPAVPFCGAPDDTSTPIEITRQSGRVFAGNHPGARDKFTGFLAPDGTVTIHYWSPSAHEWHHAFLTVTLGIEKGTYVMRGYAHGFSELPKPAPYEPHMYTLEVYLVKQ